MTWVDWTLVFSFLFGLLCLIGMLIYRHSHKNTIEMDLLLKQMRATGRLRMLTGFQRERIEALENLCLGLSDQWNNQRSVVRTKHNYDIGEFPELPESNPDMLRLFADVETEV